MRNAAAIILTALWTSAACGFAAPAPAATQRLDLPLLPPVTSSDRILILAPHPDDELLGCAGVIQHAVAARARIRVVYLTHGDHNEWAFIGWCGNVLCAGTGFCPRRGG